MERFAKKSGSVVIQECSNCGEFVGQVVYEDNKIQCSHCDHVKTIGEKDTKEYEGELDGGYTYTYNLMPNII
jgi:DNA-directed RNA polymerase subunit RPC12/RpoP